ncbi:hypothetical protein A2631_04015 [Candidatus Daviesbacteria bacterium RIFCSPHIGHO2_01_FULL_44_29]|uniref:Chorismate mutase domain-containing protein n=1 Tax=Candidatus Daviesbacteria bacterium RIFCSPHIGHO2_02_FULL_43_12 TaxID=1797776 RepID=A0A1F5KGH3_9BACT|nr:MAG: hypothetical protein A2631_04015 [Candidatus Daviesbacteria bacterium RIFCSPHIGHO2_01_FULL_44_29]OGE39895.1 MAG: hypothetical protein A3D25_03745 [Candidatus Daviesbacteria bacterium RIFCSPHIGHO2_02_FULL_43_12]OGE40692.1 MAG: hypothetical protein A3E86_04295 [Candidatus Daviesbacteria bacterium RIFCSPHIGHO2_12_FULL_47_45]OGE70424.1 MAG: hypothetical protein A3B55_01825 [Candidatus Daviesbacteria bacterium RIFCSPLOWO2_01_FULL_43_15]
MEDLNQLRKAIDQIDAKLLDLISQRIEVVKKVGEYKKLVGKPIKDPAREQERIDSLAVQGKALGLTKEIIAKIWMTFFSIAYTIEEQEGAKHD